MANDTRTDVAKIVRWSWDWWRLAARRVGYTISFLVVAGVAARVSYGHIRDVVLHVHQPKDVAYILPLAVDGLMLIATLAMAEDKANNRKPGGWARWGFWFGATISTAANVQAVMIVSGPDPLAIAVGAAAPTLLLWSIEIVARPGKPRPKVAPTAVSTTAEAVMAGVESTPSAVVATEVPAVTSTPAVVEPVPVVPEVVATTPEPTPAPVKPAPTRKPRGSRKPRAKGYPSTGAAAVEVEATIEAFRDRQANADRDDDSTLVEASV